MKVKELSIGDWVCAEQLCGVHNEPRLTPPMKVVGLGESWVNLEIDPDQGDPFEFEPSEIRGVPITPEILEKNGFEKVLSIAYEEFKWSEGEKKITLSTPIFVESDDFTLFVTSDKFLGSCFLRIKYVHELQHAMRLAGIDKEIEV